VVRVKGGSYDLMGS